MKFPALCSLVAGLLSVHAQVADNDKCSISVGGQHFSVSTGGPMPSSPAPWQVFDAEFIYAFSLCGPIMCGAFPYSAACRRPAEAGAPQPFELVPIAMVTPSPSPGQPSTGFATLLTTNDILQLLDTN